MDKKALECLINTHKKDSIMQNLLLQIHNTMGIIKNYETINTDIDQQNKKLTAENHQINLKLQTVKKTIPIIGVGCFTFGVGATLFIYSKIHD